MTKLAHVSIHSFERKNDFDYVGRATTIIENADPRIVALFSLFDNWGGSDAVEDMARHVELTDYRGGVMASIVYESVGGVNRFGTGAGTESHAVVVMPCDLEDLARAGTFSGPDLFSEESLCDFAPYNAQLAQAVIDGTLEEFLEKASSDRIVRR